MSSNNKISTLTMFRGRIFAVAVLLALAAVGTAYADNISKNFEFGAGTAYSHSIVRTFHIPCGTVGGIAAVVKFQRLGPDGAANNIPIIIELREPDTAANQEGPLVEAKTVNATKTEQSVTLRSQSSNRGCSLPWRVRVKYANDGTAPVQAFGTIRLDFDGTTRNINVGSAFLYKGGSVTKNFGTSAGLEQGKIEITANWQHVISTNFSITPGPNPIKLKWELIDPTGTTVKTVEAYSSNELRSELPKFKLIYQVTNRVPGQWKLKITNTNDKDDSQVSTPTDRFTPGCS